MGTALLTRKTDTKTDHMTFLFADAASNAEWGVRVIDETTYHLDKRSVSSINSDGRLSLANARRWYRDALRDGYKAEVR